MKWSIRSPSLSGDQSDSMPESYVPNNSLLLIILSFSQTKLSYQITSTSVIQQSFLTSIHYTNNPFKTGKAPNGPLNETKDISYNPCFNQST